ncbi:MAG: hypothetical protein CMO80_17100 [Verrucomicrobiales bacterium]|nr:hypothetical protein [Verrucomicrobiales bacterium]|tara:strand:+ start:1882 stop:2271 length:390 start_codon:yes stop_codon:yes gene_type:complete
MPRILYCHCAYAQVVPPDTKEEVLRQLCDSGVAFDAVADLCEMAARKDPALKRYAEGDVKIAACYPRAVKWIFGGVGCKLNNETTEVLNMRTEQAEYIMDTLLTDDISPNLPDDNDARKPTEEELPTAN